MIHKLQKIYILAAATLVLTAALQAAPASAAESEYLVGEGSTFDLALEASDGSTSIYLFNRVTSEPLAGAQVILQQGGGEVSFSPASTPGIYQAKVDGKIDGASVVVQTEGDADAIELSTPPYRSAPPAAAPSAKAHSLTSRRDYGMGVGGFLLGLFLGIAATMLVRRSQNGASIVLLVTTLVTTQTSDSAFAHGGHDHEDSGNETSGEQAAGGAVVLSKKSQLILGLRSMEVKKAPAPSLLQTFGHIVPKPQNDALIVAPQAGFLRGLKGAVLGRAVKRSDVLGYLQAVASVPLVSPIDGVVTEVDAVEGARVESGTKILRVTDRSTLWVDAELFQSQLSRLGQVESVAVLVEGQAEAIAGTMVQAPTPINEVTRTAKVFIELSQSPADLRLGSFAKINFLLKTRTLGMIVPADAVLNQAGERIVFVKTGPETFEPRAVMVIEGADPKTAVITKGLADGDRVVTVGNYQLLMKAK